MIPQEEITPKTHTMTRWLDVDAPVDLEGCIRPSRHSKEGAEYAILELIGDDQQAQWIILKVYTTYEQQQQMHYDGMVTYDISVHPQNQSEEEAVCYRFTELRSPISTVAADQILKEHLDREAKHLIDCEVRLVISQIRSLDDAQAYTLTILTRIQQAIQPKEKE